MKTTDVREISTGAKDSITNMKIMDSILGQMSDGYWEESRYMEGYWKFVETGASGDSLTIRVSKDAWRYNCFHRKVNNRFYRMSNAEILDFFAKKIKFIALLSEKDHYEAYIRKHMIDWKSALIPASEFDHFMKQKLAFDKYMKEHPFDPKGVFSENNTLKCAYLDDVPMSDICRFYKTLKATSKKLREENAA